MVPSMPDYHSMSAMSQHGPVAAMSGYYSPGPVLVNPPHLPTYSYGIPPSPLPFPGYPAPLLHSHASLPMVGAKQPPGLRRAGSINAKIFNAEARRPFSQPRGEAELVAHHYGYGHPGPAAPIAGNCPPGRFGTFDEASAVNHLRKNQLANEENFIEKIKDWETSTQQNFNVAKIEDAGELPGLMIEEMMESASLVQGGEEETEQGLLLEEKSVVSQGAVAAVKAKAPLKWRQATPLNTAVLFVPQQEAWIVERMGKYHKTLEPGMNVLVPLMDKVKYVHSLKEITVDIPLQIAVSSDNVTIKIDGIMFLNITDPIKASYEVEDPEYSMVQLAQTSTRAEVAKIGVDDIYKERETLNSAIMIRINLASESWGIVCLRYEVRDIN